MRNAQFTLLCVVLLMLPASSAVSAQDVVENPFRIVAFGDSTTAVRGKLKVYAQVLEKELPGRGVRAKMFNAGVGGNSTEMGRKRFDKDVLGRDPDVVIVQFGINDSAIDVWKGAKKPRVTKKRYVENLRYFAKTLHGRGIKVILMTPNPMRWTKGLKEQYGKPPYDPTDEDGFNVLLKDYAAQVRQVAKDEEVPLVDVYAAFEAYGKPADRQVDDLLLDGMHPNDKGHRIISDLLMKKITRSLPSKK